MLYLDIKMDGKKRQSGKGSRRQREEGVVAAVETVGGDLQQVELGQVTKVIQDALGPLVAQVQSIEKQLETRVVESEGIEGGEGPEHRGLRQVVELLPAQEKPTFKGGTQNPISFLEDLREYTRKTRRTDKLMVARESLKGEAKSWMKIYWGKWKTFENFEEDFLANYWGEVCQNKLRRKLSDEAWDPNGGKTMLTHFASYWELAKSLKITNSPSGVINEIMRHYPKETQALWFSREQGDELAAAEFLRRMDNMVSPPGDRYVHQGVRGGEVRGKERQRDQRRFQRGGLNAMVRDRSGPRPAADDTNRRVAEADGGGQAPRISGRAGNATEPNQMP